RRIAYRRGTEEGQIHERPRADAPHGERLTEIFVVLLEPERCRDVENTREAEGRIDQEATGVAQAFDALALQELVDRGRRVLEVAEEIADADAQPVRRDLHVAPGDGPERGTIDRVVELVDAAVQTFEALTVRSTTGGRGAARRQQGN